MMNDYGIQAEAASFWLEAGGVSRYPCDLQDAILWALRLEVAWLPNMRTHDVNRWAQRIGTSFRFTGRDRRLRGCLIAYQDAGTILIDSGDPPAEQRFTLAHETAHFLLDYQAPRRRALQALGETIRQVLDGVRAPTRTERVHALLADAPLGVLSHLMERPDDGIPTSTVIEVEDRADRLALELLAPRDEVKRCFSNGDQTLGFDARLARLHMVLLTEFGLPRAIAADYARMLLESWGGFTVRDWLFEPHNTQDR